MNLPCDRCGTPWPVDLLTTLDRKKVCGICWRVMVYPSTTTKQYRNRKRYPTAEEESPQEVGYPGVAAAPADSAME